MTPTEVTTLLRQFNEWRRDGAAPLHYSPSEIGEAIDAAIAMIDRLESAESDALEQARLNGMGSEREAALMAKLEAAEKDIAVKEEVIDSLAAVVKRLDAQCDAAERERDELRAKIETAENDAAHQKALAASALRVAEGWERKCGELRAKIEEMEKQEPAAWRTFDGEGGYDYRSYEDNENYKLGWDARNPNHIGWVEPLYALPGAQAQLAQSMPEVTDAMALAFRHALTDGSIGAREVEEIKDALRAALAAAPKLEGR